MFISVNYVDAILVNAIRHSEINHPRAADEAKLTKLADMMGIAEIAGAPVGHVSGD